MRAASLTASWAGVTDLGVAEYPGAIQLHTEAEIRANLEKGVFDRIIEALTAAGRNPNVVTASSPSEKVVFRGSLDEVNKFFSEMKWTDGLPIIPPTAEKIEEFLKYTDYAPDQEVAVLPQANLRATPRNIAANAVMAGCRPEFMPLLIAAVEAIGEPDFQLMNLGSTGCKTPWLLVNGPIVKQLGIEYGVAARSRGPNPAIGRAVGLIVNNIAGFRPGETLLGTWGYYLPFILAEDEDACAEIGWEPYNVEHGYSRGTSTVTARATIYWGGQGQLRAPLDPSAVSVLKVACEHQERNTMPQYLRFGPRNMVAVLLTPPTAKVLANAGHSKRDVAKYLWENARITVGKEDDLLQGFTGVGLTVHELVEEGTLPKWFDVGPSETIPVFESADLIDVIVCGDAHRDKIMSLSCNYFRPVTKEVRLPAAWPKLLDEAKK